MLRTIAGPGRTHLPSSRPGFSRRLVRGCPRVGQAAEAVNNNG